MRNPISDPSARAPRTARVHALRPVQVSVLFIGWCARRCATAERARTAAAACRTGTHRIPTERRKVSARCRRRRAVRCPPTRAARLIWTQALPLLSPQCHLGCRRRGAFLDYLLDARDGPEVLSAVGTAVTPLVECPAPKGRPTRPLPVVVGGGGARHHGLMLLLEVRWCRPPTALSARRRGTRWSGRPLAAWQGYPRGGVAGTSRPCARCRGVSRRVSVAVPDTLQPWATGAARTPHARVRGVLPLLVMDFDVTNAALHELASTPEFSVKPPAHDYHARLDPHA